MSSIWKINGVDVATLGAVGLNYSPANQAADAFSFSVPGPIDGSALLAYDSPVVLTRIGVTWFRGTALSPRRGPGSGRAEQITYRAVGPWAKLERRTLLQDWQQGFAEDPAETVTKAKGRVITGVDSDGDAQSAAATITQMLNYAIGSGVAIAIGAISVPLMLPPRELINVTIAEGIRAILRAAPDAVAWFDYAVNPPALNIRQAADLDEVEFDYLDASQAIAVEACDDRRVSAVVLKYEVISSVDGVERSDIIEDKAPAEATGREDGALVQTIPWEGSDSQYLKQKVVTRPIRMDIDDTDNLNHARRYWTMLEVSKAMAAAKLVTGASPATPVIDFLDLKNYTDESGTQPFSALATGVKFKRKLRKVDGTDSEGDYQLEDPDDVTSTKIRLDEDLTRELIEGQIQPWMTGVEAQEQIIYAYIMWQNEDGVYQPARLITAHVLATDATTKQYTSLESYTDGPAVPTGLAAAMLATLGRLEHKGEILKVQEECTHLARLGQRCTIGAGAAEWAAMTAIVQAVDHSLDDGITRIQFGPPEHLSPQDFIELQRINRRPEGATGLGRANDQTRRDATV